MLRAMLTQLALLRHGRAESQAADADLLPAGEAHIRALGRRLAADGIVPAAAFSSPYRRAHRTALLLLEAIAPRLEPTLLRELAPDSDVDAALSALHEAGLPRGLVLVVAHMPLVGQMALRLAGADPGFTPGTWAEFQLADDGGSGSLVRRLGAEDLGL